MRGAGTPGTAPRVGPTGGPGPPDARVRPPPPLWLELPGAGAGRGSPLMASRPRQAGENPPLTRDKNPPKSPQSLPRASPGWGTQASGPPLCPHCSRRIPPRQLENPGARALGPHPHRELRAPLNPAKGRGWKLAHFGAVLPDFGASAVPSLQPLSFPAAETPQPRIYPRGVAFLHTQVFPVQPRGGVGCVCSPDPWVAP